MSNWYKWDSIESFDSWHSEIKLELGLPKPSIYASGEIVPDGVINDEYTLPVIVAVNDVRALVQEQYANGLTLTTDPLARETIPE